jgi:hypothetical protein
MANCRRVDAKSGVGEATMVEDSAIYATVGSTIRSEAYLKGCSFTRSDGCCMIDTIEGKTVAKTSNKRKLFANDRPCPKTG